jgi:hypothetical protein
MIETPTRVLKSPSAPLTASPSTGPTTPALTPAQPATGGRPGPPMRRPSAQGKSILLRIRLFPYVESGAQSTMLEVTADNYFSEVLDMICKKLHLDKSLYVLRLPGTSIMIPSSRRVETLQGRSELELIRKTTLEALDAGGTSNGTPASIGTSGTSLHLFRVNKSDRRDGQKAEKVGATVNNRRSIQSHHKRLLSSSFPPPC